jgi:type I restriction enzyme, S subunit
MSSDACVGRYSIGDLIKAGVISAHKDGNFGSLYPRIEDFVDDGFPLLTAKVVNAGRVDFNAAQKLSKEKAAQLPYGFIQAEDVLLSHNATVGRVAVVPEFTGKALIGTSLTYFRLDKSRLLPRYLACFFESRDFQNQLASVMGLSTRNQVPITAQRLLEVEVPPMSVQYRISEFVGALDDRITLLRETNATLEAIAQALFKSWFVDFDPVRAKMEGRAPEGMDEATAALFPDALEETELGLVPKGWRVMPVGDAIEAIGGATPDTKNPDYWEPGVHCWTTPKDLSGISAPVLLETERKLSDLGLSKIGSGLLPAGSLLLSSRAPIGYLALTQTPMAINQGYIGMVSGGLLPPIYMLFWCRENMESIKGRANGSTFMEISKKAFRPILALIPSPEAIEAFANVAGVLFERLVENEKQAKTLSILRDTLLPRLISGQLRVDEIVAAVES